MNPIVYKSTDSGAPVLTGQAGSFIAVLDACLINGFGSKAALGWTKVFSTTNGAVYRAPTGLRHYFQVLDDGTDTNGAKIAKVTGFETMTAWNTGAGLFPTAAQLATGTFWVKSITADATARPWTLVGDDRTIYFVADMGTGLIYPLHGFGEVITVKVGDLYSSFVSGGAATAANGVVSNGLTFAQTLGSATVNDAGLYLARSYTQIGTSQPAYVISPQAGQQILGNTGITYPNAVDSGLYLDPVPVAEAIAGGPIRGRIRGMFAPLHATPLQNYDTVSDAIGYPGRTLMALRASRQNGLGMVFFDITGPW